MDVTALTTLIGSVGTPTVICLLLLKYMQEQNELHRQETNSMKDAITKLEVAITALTSRLDRIDKVA